MTWPHSCKTLLLVCMYMIYFLKVNASRIQKGHCWYGNSWGKVGMKGLLFFKYIIYFLERGKGRDKERERNSNQLPLVCPQPGTWPSTLACALTGNQTSDPLARRPALNPLSHSSQGRMKWLLRSHITVCCTYFSII